LKILSLLLILSFLVRPKPGKVVQFDITPVLNARPVTTLTNNRLITWATGIDGGGKGDGYLTQSAALFNKDKDAHALPDNALFPADSFHPEIKFHYSNRDSLSNQTCNMAGVTSVKFKVAKAKYKALYLALTSSEGASALQIELIYSDGSDLKNVLLPDYYQDLPANDPNMCYLAHDLAKWGNANQMTEKNHHNIDLLKLLPDATRTLTGIKISKGKEGYLVFWSAAGVRK
jgi:hypothetical protein